VSGDEAEARSSRTDIGRQDSERSDWMDTPNWWWTLARAGTECAHCCAEVASGSLIAYDSHGKEVLCQMCADTNGVSGECKWSKKAKRVKAG